MAPVDIHYFLVAIVARDNPRHWRRQLLAFPTQASQGRFREYLANNAGAQLTGDWYILPNGNSVRDAVTRARTELAFVYDLPRV